MKFRNIFIESKSRCSFKLGYLVVVSANGTKKIHLDEISSIVVETVDCYLSSYLLQEIAKHNIMLICCDEKHNPVGEFLSLYGNYRCPKRLVKQIKWSLPNKKRTWQQIVIHKIQGQANVLGRHNKEEALELLKYSNDVKSGDSTFQESKAASLYFKSLFGIEFSRSQETDINAALNYGYAILLSFVNRQIVSKGYVTQLGICHKNEFNQFNLGCDFMEPFRPYVDLVVLNNFSGKFSKELKLGLVNMFNGVVSYDGGLYKVASVINYYIEDCLNSLNSKIKPKDIKGFSID